MKKILITGGAGFIGSNLVNYLLSRYENYRVMVLDALTYCGRLENFNAEVRAHPHFMFCRGDVRNQEAVDNLVRNAEVIIHLAAETHIDRSINQPDIFVSTDILGTHRLLESIRRFPVERFIHVSSSEVYGKAQQIPMTEEHSLCPQSPYAAAKTGADRLVYAYGLTYDLPVMIVRPFNNYGPYQYPEKLIPLFIARALSDQPLPVYGEGKFTRDWLHVDDHCRALDKIIHADFKKLQGETINLGTGRETDVLTVARLILKSLGKPESLLKHTADRPAHVKRHLSAVSKSRLLLDWKARIGLESGLKQTIDWYQSHQDWWLEISKLEKENDQSFDYWNYRASG